jgi:hypothetical protein
MGLVSEACYRLKVFGSSLLLVDGSFFARSLGLRPSKVVAYGAGALIHLVTSGFFGAVYLLFTAMLGLNPLQLAPVIMYFTVLWLAMLLVALPVAGQGFLGRSAGAYTWLEQLALHIVFGACYFVILKALF